uniref:Putative ovule protein n=1 Tax=Solanum chacoense TaxID=4108 RepID=A0A0V0HAF0_SOLCH
MNSSIRLVHVLFHRRNQGARFPYSYHPFPLLFERRGLSIGELSNYSRFGCLCVLILKMNGGNFF